MVSVLYQQGEQAGLASVLAGGQSHEGPLRPGGAPGTAGPGPGARPAGARRNLPGRRRVRRLRPAGRRRGGRLALRLPHGQERAPGRSGLAGRRPFRCLRIDDLQPGDCVELAEHLFTAQGFGPVLVGAVWERGQEEPLLLVTSLDFLSEARLWYRKRFGIETFFSDQKSRGFYLCHSHLSQPGAPVPAADGDVPCLLLDGLPGGRSRAARVAERYSPGQAVRPEPVPTRPGLAGTLPQRRLAGSRSGCKCRPRNETQTKSVR